MFIIFVGELNEKYNKNIIIKTKNNDKFYKVSKCITS